MRKHRIVNILKNKFVAGVFALALVVFGVVLFADTYEAQATETTANTVAFKSESLEVSEYFDEDGNRIAPKPTGNGYEDWIFAGWYKEADCINAVNSKSGKRWAKFVPSEVLSVKCQTTAESVNDPTSSLRLVSTVDSLRYSKVGFEVSYEFGAQGLNIDTTNVYKKIESAFEGQEYDFSPNIFDLQSQYFVTATLTNINADNYGDGFFIKPYWVTLDGTKVYGVSRYARVEDSYLDIVNVPVRLYSNETVAGGEVVVDYSTLKLRDGQTDAFALYSVDGNASYDVGDIFSSVTISDNTENKQVTCTLPNDVDATKADGMLVNLRFQTQSAENTVLPKVNEFVVTASLQTADSQTADIVTSNAVYHYYHTDYTGTADTDWYDANETEFVITSPDELYGFAKLVNNGTITTQKINLGSNISVNKNTIDTSAENWSAGLIQWVPIGESETNAFKGHFDGQGHVISGLCQTSTTSNFGLCSYASGDCIIENLSLSNSAFALTSGTTRMGSFVARAQGGTFRELYSEAKLESSYAYVGGILGTVEGEVEVSNVCFKGSIESTGNYDGLGVGGLVGWIQYGPATMQHCLNAGSVNISGAAASKNLGVGGLIGYIDNTAKITDNGDSPKVTVEDSFNVGYITTSNGGISRVATLIGSVNSSQVTITNTYATKESCAIEKLAAYTDHNPLYQKGKSPTVTNVAMIDEATLYGIGGASNTELDFDNYWTIVDGNTPTLKTWLKQDGLYIPDTDWSGEGTEDNPWVITTAEELYGLADNVNVGEPYQGKYFVLGADIKVNSGSASAWEKNPAKYNWIPIGKTGSPAFAGHFNGQGHTISGLYYKKTDATAEYIGLFGKTTADSSVQNVYIKNSHFEYTGSKAGVYMGSAAGYGGGTFDAIYSDAILKHNIYGVGGIVGATDMNLTISNCWYAGKLTSTRAGEAWAGGILGYTTAGVNRISHCLNSGEIHSDLASGAVRLGGIVGFINSKNPDMIIDDCLNSGKITTNGSISQMATIAGMCNTGTITNSYATEESCGMDDLFELGTQTLYQGTVTATNVQMLEENELYDIAAYNRVDIAYWTARVDEAPIPSVFADAGSYQAVAEKGDIYAIDKELAGAGTEENPYEISTVEDLYGFAVLAKTHDFAGEFIELTNNITVNKTVDKDNAEAVYYDWYPIGNETVPFAGTFIGNGHTISGLHKAWESSTPNLGLFAATADTSKLSDFRITNTYFHYDVNDDSAKIGSVAGKAYGTIEKVYSDATLLSYGRGTGGIVGYSGVDGNSLTITNCWFDGSIHGLKPASSPYIGGIAGVVHTPNSTISHCLVSGDVLGLDKRVGGLVGSVCNGTMTMTDCLFSGDITGGYAVNSGDYAGYEYVGQLIGSVEASATGTTVTVNSSYGVNDYAPYDIGTKVVYNSTETGTIEPTVNGAGYVSKQYDRLIGYAGTTASLDYTQYWTLVKEGTPILKYFANAADIYDGSQIDALLELDYWNSENVALSKAEDKGQGTYMLTISGSNLTAYNEYLAALDAGIFDAYGNDQSSNLNTEGVYNAIYTSAKCGDSENDDWVVNVTYVDETIYISISTGQPVSQHLKADSIVPYTTEGNEVDDGYTTSGLTPTFHMLEEKYYSASSYVIQLSNGHFIVIDGGINSEAPYLMDYMTSLIPEDGKKPIIEAWVLSHGHLDHVGTMMGFVQNASVYAGKVYLEGIYFSEPNDSVTTAYDDKHHQYMGYIGKITSVFKTTKGEEAEIYRMYTGQRYTFDGVTMDIMLAQELLTASDYAYNESGVEGVKNVFNETSTWTMFTINDKKLLTAGDAAISSTKRIVSMYSESYLTVDAFTALHHGMNLNRGLSYSPLSTNNDAFCSALTVTGVVLYSYQKDWLDLDANASEYTIVDRNKDFINGQTKLTGVFTTYADDSTGTAKYLYYGQGTSVLTFGDDGITAEVKGNFDWETIANKWQ